MVHWHFQWGNSFEAAWNKLAGFPAVFIGPQLYIKNLLGLHIKWNTLHRVSMNNNISNHSLLWRNYLSQWVTKERLQTIDNIMVPLISFCGSVVPWLFFPFANQIFFFLSVAIN